MGTVPNANDESDVMVRLRDEFSDWSIICTRDTGRWWATRGPLTREFLNRQADVDADTAEELAEKLRAVDRDR